jgi:hypothetical protein
MMQDGTEKAWLHGSTSTNAHFHTRPHMHVLSEFNSYSRYKKKVACNFREFVQLFVLIVEEGSFDCSQLPRSPNFVQIRNQPIYVCLRKMKNGQTSVRQACPAPWHTRKKELKKKRFCR